MNIDWQQLWSPQIALLEVVLRASIIYLFIQLLLRVMGRKELGRYSTFDATLLFLITTAARTSIVADDTSVTSALVGLATIVGWNWLFSYLAFRSETFATIVEGPVRRLIVNGELQLGALHRARISHRELLANLRQHGHESLERVRDAYLERSGTITFVMREEK
jgi:uncharacterized membrane protein YcaP (DUF421 family)